MARLRVKLILNEGGEGVPLAQLTDIAEEAEKFLRYLAQDAGLLTVQRNEWLARNFENASVRFDIERESIVDIEAVKEFNRKLEYVDNVKREQPAPLQDTKDLFIEFLTSGRVVQLVEADIFVSERARDLYWKDGLRLRGADGLHVATAILEECPEFLTLDGKIKGGKFSAAIPKFKSLGVSVLRPSETGLLPNEYKQGDIFQQEAQNATAGPGAA